VFNGAQCPCNQFVPAPSNILEYGAVVYLVIEQIVNVVGTLPDGHTIVLDDDPVRNGIDAVAPFPVPNVNVTPDIVAFRPFPVKSYKLVLVLLACPAIYAPQGTGTDIVTFNIITSSYILEYVFTHNKYIFIHRTR